MVDAVLDLASPVATLGLTPTQLIGIPLALLGAVFMSLGAKYQHQGVSKVSHAAEARAGRDAGGSDPGLGMAQLRALLARPSWLAGTAMLGLAIVLQLASLAFSPLIVVQPVGVISLVLTTILTARDSGHGLSRAKVIAVALCVVGVSIFVTVAALSSVEAKMTPLRITWVLAILGVVVVLFGIAFVTLRRRFTAIFYIVGAGVIYGFVATLAKITISRFQQGEFDALTIVGLVMIVVGTALGAYFVQTAYGSGPPDMVVAGLTVIDPLVAVLVGIAVLGETEGAPWTSYLGFAVAGSMAIAGVLLLEREQSAEQIAAARDAAIRGRRDRSRGPESRADQG